MPQRPGAALLAALIQGGTGYLQGRSAKNERLRQRALAADERKMRRLAEATKLRLGAKTPEQLAEMDELVRALGMKTGGREAMLPGREAFVDRERGIAAPGVAPEVMGPPDLSWGAGTEQFPTPPGEYGAPGPAPSEEVEFGGYEELSPYAAEGGWGGPSRRAVPIEGGVPGAPDTAYWHPPFRLRPRPVLGGSSGLFDPHEDKDMVLEALRASGARDYDPGRGGAPVHLPAGGEDVEIYPGRGDRGVEWAETKRFGGASEPYTPWQTLRARPEAPELPDDTDLYGMSFKERQTAPSDDLSSSLYRQMQQARDAATFKQGLEEQDVTTRMAKANTLADKEARYKAAGHPWPPKGASFYYGGGTNRKALQEAYNHKMAAASRAAPGSKQERDLLGEAAAIKHKMDRKAGVPGAGQYTPEALPQVLAGEAGEARGKIRVKSLKTALASRARPPAVQAKRKKLEDNLKRSTAYAGRKYTQGGPRGTVQKAAAKRAKHKDQQALDENDYIWEVGAVQRLSTGFERMLQDEALDVLSPAAVAQNVEDLNNMGRGVFSPIQATTGAELRQAVEAIMVELAESGMALQFEYEDKYKKRR